MPFDKVKHESDVLKHWIIILAPWASIAILIIGFIVWFVRNDTNNHRDIANLDDKVTRVLVNQERNWSRVQSIDSVVYRIVVPYIEQEKEQAHARLYGHAELIP